MFAKKDETDQNVWKNNLKGTEVDPMVGVKSDAWDSKMHC